MTIEPNFYAIIPATIRYDKDLMDKAKLIYAEISALTNKHGYCFANNQYFADLYGVSIRQITTIISVLEKKGYIKTERRGGERKIFVFDVLTPKKTSIDVEENFHVEVEEKFHHNNTSINNKNNNKKNIKKSDEKYTPEFETWYKNYPNPWNKCQTFKNWNTALKTHTVKELYTALTNYKAEIERKGTSRDYITRSTNFLGKKGEFRGWLELNAPQTNPQQPEQTLHIDEDYEERLRRFRNVC